METYRSNPSRSEADMRKTRAKGTERSPKHGVPRGATAGTTAYPPPRVEGRSDLGEPP